LTWQIYTYPSNNTNNYTEQLFFHYILDNTKFVNVTKSEYFSNQIVKDLFDIAKELNINNVNFSYGDITEASLKNKNKYNLIVEVLVRLHIKKQHIEYLS